MGGIDLQVRVLAAEPGLGIFPGLVRERCTLNHPQAAQGGVELALFLQQPEKLLRRMIGSVL